MNGFDFEQLKDIDFSIPERWVEKALDAPSQQRKSPAPVRLYRFAIGAAACIVLAAAVAVSLIFGVNKKVDLTNPWYDTPVIAEQTTAEYTTANADSVETTTETPLDSAEDKTVEVTTEPAEDVRAENGNGSKTTDSKPSEKTGNERASSPRAIPGNAPAEGATDSSAKATEAEEPETTQTACLPDYTTPQGETFPPGCVIVSKVDSSLVSGAVYCRLIDSDGKTVGSDDLYSASRRAETKETGSGKITMTYNVSDSEVKEGAGKELYAVFYDAGGNVLKKSSMFYIFESLYFFFG